ncbi:myosin light chain kinase, smooth muscle-like [Leptonychotes weddellii]|uniref:Myosin light chain kinase, smooth muscle-like n=1 Tax=Leptonychotes weddellii TaxID=9713 RepID=A0A7F8Q6K3_LEPWE|nr:myosin light chain kinase, smooth muscle-like [Leptonychotes weddellii]
MGNAKPAETPQPMGNAKPAETPKPMGNAKPAETPKPAGKELKKEVKNDVNCKRGHAGATDNENRSENQGTAPTFKEKLQDVRVTEGEKLLLQCQVSSDPPATITWTLNGKTLKTTKFIILSQEGRMKGGQPPVPGAYAQCEAHGYTHLRETDVRQLRAVPRATQLL